MSDKSNFTINYYKEIPATTLVSSPVNCGNGAAESFQDEITGFNLNYPARRKPEVGWVPVEGVTIKLGMSLVVIGTYDAPSLAITLEIGGPQIVKLIIK